MRLSIRWKFILSIGLTLLVTYVALLTWDYRWQRETAALQMQDLVTTKAHGLASGLNLRFSSAARQAEALVAAIQNSPPADTAKLQQLLADARPNGNLLVFWQFEPSTDFRGAEVFRISNEPGGGGFGRGGRGRGGGRDGPATRPPFGRDGRGREGRGEGRDGRTEGRGDGRGRRGPPVRIASITDDGDRRSLATSLSRLPHSEWSPPRFEENILPGLFCLYSVPVMVGENIRGLVVAIAPTEDLAQYLPPPPVRGPGSATMPASRPAASATETVVILDEQGRRIWPREPGPPQARGESILEQAVNNQNEVLAEHLHAALGGDSRVASVADINALVPGSVDGETYWVALEPIAAADWVVAAATPESRFMSRIIDRLWQRALFLVAGLMLLLAIVTLVSIRLTRPIERMAGAVQQLAEGNLDAQVTGVESRDELGQLARAFNTMTRQLKQHVADLTEQTAARQSVEAELRIARQIQSDLLPRTFPPFPDRKEFELHAVNVAAKRVAGDFFDFFFAPNGLLTITIADVAGKGMPAALLMAVTRTIIRNLAMEGHSPAQIIERANTLLVQDITNSMFVTLFLCQYDTRTGRIVYVNAGHPHPYRFGNNGSPHHFGEVTGAILGVNPNGGDWAFEEREEQLGVGETLLLYTDGVTEARAPDDSMLRDAGLEQLIAKYGGENVETICAKFVEEVNRFQHGHQSDDITLLALRRTL